MSSSPILTTIQRQLNFYGYPIFLTLGNIGNIFIVILFSRQRQNPSAIYLLSLAIMNDLYLTFNSFIQIFPFYYADQSLRAIALCKIRFYVSNVLGQIAKTMIVLACIDRFMVTSHRATFRAFSKLKRAKLFIFMGIIFWPLFASHIAIMTTIINRQCDTFGVYSIFYDIYTLIFVGLVPPIISGIFGYLTYCNMKHVRVQPVANDIPNTNNSIRRRDREFLIIVMSEVIAYVITTTPYPLILLEMMISRYVISNKSAQYSQIENFIFTVAFLLLFVNNAMPFYIYLISSKPFRRDFKKLFISFYRKLRVQPIVPIIPRTKHNTLIRRDIHK